jgi:integrase
VTAAGRRQVRLSGEALRVLREQLLARAPKELMLVFPTPNGSVWRKDNFMARIFRPAVRRSRLEPPRFHDLRHTYAALMIAAGADPKLPQSQLGHTSINVTLNTYDLCCWRRRRRPPASADPAHIPPDEPLRATRRR